MKLGNLANKLPVFCLVKVFLRNKHQVYTFSELYECVCKEFKIRPNKKSFRTMLTDFAAIKIKGSGASLFGSDKAIEQAVKTLRNSGLQYKVRKSASQGERI